MRTFMLVLALLLGAALAGAQIQPTQQSPPANPQIPGEPGTPGTPPTFPRQQIPPDQTIPQAQTPEPPAAQQVPPEQTNPVGTSTAITVQGCLSGADGNYSISDPNGATYQLVGSDRLLSSYVGHMVQVTGTTTSSRTSVSTSPPDTPVTPETEENEPMPSVEQPGNPPQAGDHTPTLNVTSVKEVAKSCSENPR